MGAEQGDTPPCCQHHWRWEWQRERERRKGEKEGGKGNMLKTGRQEGERECECIYLLGCHSGRDIFDVNSISIWCVETQLRLEWNPGWFTAPQKESVLAGNSRRDHTAQKCAVARLHTWVRTGVTIWNMFPLPAGDMISMVCSVLEGIVWFVGIFATNPKSVKIFSFLYVCVQFDLTVW